jgi:hypothetical protein
VKSLAKERPSKIKDRKAYTGPGKTPEQITQVKALIWLSNNQKFKINSLLFAI